MGILVRFGDTVSQANVLSFARINVVSARILIIIIKLYLNTVKSGTAGPFAGAYTH